MNPIDSVPPASMKVPSDVAVSVVVGGGVDAVAPGAPAARPTATAARSGPAQALGETVTAAESITPERSAVGAGHGPRG